MNKINYEEVRKRLEFARKNSGISLEDAGKILGVHKTTIQRWEKGKTEKIQLPIFEKLAEMYNVNTMWLMGYDVPMKRTSNTINDLTNTRMASYQGYINDEDLEPEDIEEIERFIEFVKNKRKKK